MATHTLACVDPGLRLVPGVQAHRGVFEPPKDADGVLRSLRELGGVIIPAEHDDELDWLLRYLWPNLFAAANRINR
jgi:hypothetical protein